MVERIGALRVGGQPSARPGTVSGAHLANYAGVRARFSKTAGSGALLGFCTMQESVTFSADFRIAK